MVDDDGIVSVNEGDAVVVFRDTGNVDVYGPDETTTFDDTDHPLYKAMLVATLFRPDDDECEEIRDRLVEIATELTLIETAGRLN